MNNENNVYEGSILRNALEEMKHHKKCCCPRFIPGPTCPTFRRMWRRLRSCCKSIFTCWNASVDINAGGQTVAQGDVLKSEYEMVVIVGNDNSNPSFVSLCKAEIINK